MQNEENRTDEQRKPQPILERTKEFALRVIRLYSALPSTTEAQVIGKQVLRSGTSVGAQCREGHRSRSNAEFISKMNSALMELEETTYWLELLIDAKIVPESRMTDIVREAGELTAIIVTIINNTKKRQNSK